MKALSLTQGNRISGKHLAFALLLMAQLQLWDAVITQVLVGNGIARELNPFILNSVNQGSFIVIKIAGLILCVACLWLIGKKYPALATAAAAIIAVLYTGIVSWNFAMIFAA
jgi:hypothetical protein